MKKPHHYFAACSFGWVSDDNMIRAIDRLRKEFQGKVPNEKFWIIISKVPGPESSTYAIDNFRPVVDGTVTVYSGAAG